LLHENSRPQSHVGIVGSTPPTGVTRSEDSRRLPQTKGGPRRGARLRARVVRSADPYGRSPPVLVDTVDVVAVAGPQSETTGSQLSSTIPRAASVSACSSAEV
jgi:hypothetical protein